MPDINPWDAARKLKVFRGNPPSPVDPGVNFFVLMLEQLGCTTADSCEGDPFGFYVTFRGPDPVARAVKDCGWFGVALWRSAEYRLDLESSENANLFGIVLPYTTRRRNRTLRRAADSWVETFGPLGAPGPVGHTPTPDLARFKKDFTDFNSRPAAARTAAPSASPPRRP
jgi:hypothetical protein